MSPVALYWSLASSENLQWPLSKHHTPTLASFEVSSTRESDATTESLIDRHCNERGQVQDDGIGMGEIA